MTFSWRVKSVSGSLIWKEGPITQINDLIEQIFIEMWARKDFQLVKVSEIASSLQIDLSDYRQILTMSSHLQSHRDLNIFYSSRWDGSLGRRLNLTKTFSRLSTISFSGEAFTVPVSHTNKRPFQTRKRNICSSNKKDIHPSLFAILFPIILVDVGGKNESVHISSCYLTLSWISQSETAKEKKGEMRGITKLLTGDHSLFRSKEDAEYTRAKHFLASLQICF